ncbi:MAG: hypothetical protein WCH84_02360 [Verrucomicrobiota bacterium]
MKIIKVRRMDFIVMALYQLHLAAVVKPGNTFAYKEFTKPCTAWYCTDTVCCGEVAEWLKAAFC